MLLFGPLYRLITVVPVSLIAIGVSTPNFMREVVGQDGILRHSQLPICVTWLA